MTDSKDQGQDERGEREQADTGLRGRSDRGGRGERGQGFTGRTSGRGLSHAERLASKVVFNDEDGTQRVRGADDDEDDDVAAMVLAVSERDRKLEHDLAAEPSARGGKRSGAGEMIGVVEFDGDGDDDGRGGKRRRTFAHGEVPPKGAVPPGGKKVPKATEEGAPVRHIPGKLANVDILPGKDSAQVELLLTMDAYKGG